MFRQGPTQAILLGCLLLSLSHCERRAPPEPVPATPPSARSKNRCTIATPEQPPPAPPAGPDPRCPADPDGQPPQVPISTVRFVDAPNAPSVRVETMLTEDHRMRGLMFRKVMPEDHGMIFVFDDNQPRSFWMHNTCLPLDMLFIADDGYITGILENVPTMNDDSRGIPCKAKFVLELNAGVSRKLGLKAGQKLKIEN